jgi:hypothetical protein
MRTRPSSSLLAPALLVAGALAAAGCSKDDPPAPAGGGGPTPYALAADLPGGMPAGEARAAAPKKDVVVVGRAREFVKGFAAFSLIDARVPYCGQNEMEGCPTPWDYCCHVPDIAPNSVGVIVKAKDGSVASLDAIPELRNLDLVAVRGDLVKDEAGNVTLEATGWYRRERPKLPDGLDWSR